MTSSVSTAAAVRTAPGAGARPAQRKHPVRPARIVLHAFLVQGAGEVVVVDDPQPFPRPAHDRDHAMAKIVATIAIRHFAPVAPLARDLTIADRHLRGPQVVDPDGVEHGFVVNHQSSPESAAATASSTL